MWRTLAIVLLAGCLSSRAHGRSPIGRIAAVGASAFVGFGTGQAIEGEWSTRGWTFAVADSVFVASYVVGLRGLGCISRSREIGCDELAYTTLMLGVLGVIGSHLWQVCAD